MAKHKVPERLKSRKLWVVIITGVLAALGEATGVKIDPDTQQLLAITISSYLIGQSAVDWSRSRENASKYAAWMATQMNQGTYGTSNGSDPRDDVSGL